MMQAGDTLVLRDIHAATAPSWWPPAPGWWIVAGVLLASLAALVAWNLHRRRRRARILALFDDEVAAAATPAAEVAAISALLRRAARRVRGDADRLRGDDWLRLLDGDGGHFGDDALALLGDGAFRRDADPAAVAALRAAARLRFAAWMRR